jgi:hypothetical protein
MENLRKIKLDFGNLVNKEFTRIEESENRFLQEFIEFMESPLDKNTIIHNEPDEFRQSYELYLQEYTDRKNKAEDSKKRNISILNFAGGFNKDELINLGVFQSYQDLSASINTFIEELKINLKANARKI